MPQLRQNIITGEWVVVAPERAKRPDDFIVPKPESNLDKKSTENCPFCPSSEAYASRYLEHDRPLSYMMPNKFPAFIAEGEHEVRSYSPPEGFYRAKPAIGGHDLVVIKDHHLSLPLLDHETLTELLQNLQQRYLIYRSYNEIEYIMAIYNHGEAAGASLSHPHGQIFASSIVPEQIKKELSGSERYYELNGECVFCTMVEHEIEEQVRLIYQNENFIAITFYAARFPFEIWILPKKHESVFEKISTQSIDQLADCLATSLKLLNLTLKNPDLNFFIHSLPTTSESADYYHWHLEITPRVTRYGGFEIGGGTIIDVVSPEQAAGFLRANN